MLAEPGMVRKIIILAEHAPIRHVLQTPIFASLVAIAIWDYPWTKIYCIWQ